MHPQNEDYWGNVNPIGPRGVYDEAKRFAEAMTMAYHRAHGVQTRIVRIFNTYGPRMRLRRRPGGAELHRPGAPRRADDGLRRRLADAQLLLRLRPGRGHRAAAALATTAAPVNFGNPREVTDPAVRQASSWSSPARASEIVYKPLPEDDPKVRQPDITRARTLLGWEPKVGLEEGLRRTIEYFRDKV